MIIYNKAGEVVLDIEVDDSSTRVRKIMQDNSVTLYYSLITHVEIPVYSYIIYEGQRYTLWKPGNFVKKGTRNFEYTVVFGSYQELLKRFKFKLTAAIPYELKFPITATPRLILEAMVDSLNINDSGWSAGECIEMPEIVFSVNHEYVWDSLVRLAEQCKTEFEIENKVIHLRKVERFKTVPLALSYGKGNGFCPGLTRQNKGNKAPVTILYVQGGERNIDLSKYGSRTLLLPRNQTLEYEGRLYKTDEYGMCVTRADRELTTYNEDSYDASDIHPSRVGEISRVSFDANTSVYSFVDDSIPSSLNFEDCLIEGETMTVIFQTGALTGREFDVKYIHAERRFDIVPATMDGYLLPTHNLQPAEGDKYAVFHIALPDDYVCNNAEKTGASWDMFRQAARYLYENEEEVFSFTGELDGIWANKRWTDIHNYLVPGGYISLSDTQFQPEPVLIRITGVTDYINNSRSPQLELSNAPVGGYIGSELGKIDANEVTDNQNNKNAISYSKRYFRNVLELMNALSGSLLNFTEGIRPMWVQTMQAIVGDESLQFAFIQSWNNPVEVGHNFIYNASDRTFRSPAGTIMHMTLGIDKLAPSHDPSEFRYWDVSALDEVLVDDEKRYLYIKCSKTSEDAEFVLSKTPIAMEGVPGYYHFLTGMLNSVYEGNRDFTPLYGFTEITPGRMRVNQIVSNDGTQFWDMLNQRFFIGNGNSSLSYNINGDGQVILKGTLLQTSSGEPIAPDVFRGPYSTITRYYDGDIVTYNGSTYRCKMKGGGINAIPPTNTEYWDLYVSKGDTGATGSTGSKGTDGTDGQGYVYAYWPSDSLTPPARPATTSSSAIPSGWWTYPNFAGYKYIYVTQKIQENGVWGAWSNPTLYGMMPEDGDPGPATVYRGDFSQIITPRIFYNNAVRRDVVKYGSTYYIYKGTDGATNNTWASGNWESFGAQFSSVATDLLLAVNANLAGWIYRNERLESQSGGAYMDGRTGAMQLGNGNFIVDVNGNVSIAGQLYAQKGFRVGIRSVNSPNITLTPDDCYVGITTNINLPSTPRVGQLLYIGSRTTTILTINGNGNKIVGTNGILNTSIQLPSWGSIQLLYIGYSEWVIMSTWS